MYNFIKQDTFKKCQRSFNVSEPIDEKFINLVKSTRDEFISLEELDINSFVITDVAEIKLIHSCAIFQYEQPDLAWRTNTQVLAPLLIMCMPTKNKDINSLIQIGRLQTKLGMMAIEHGYLTGFCLCFNVYAMSSWNTIKKYVQTDPITGRFVPPITLSIGLPMDESKPHNWSYIHNKFHPKHIRNSYPNIT